MLSLWRKQPPVIEIWSVNSLPEYYFFRTVVSKLINLLLIRREEERDCPELDNEQFIKIASTQPTASPAWLVAPLKSFEIWVSSLSSFWTERQTLSTTSKRNKLIENGKKGKDITMPTALELKARKRKDYKFNLEYRTRWYSTWQNPLANQCNYLGKWLISILG